MSRHRAVRGMVQEYYDDEEEAYEDDNYDDDDEEEEEDQQEVEAGNNNNNTQQQQQQRQQQSISDQDGAVGIHSQPPAVCQNQPFKLPFTLKSLTISSPRTLHTTSTTTTNTITTTQTQTQTTTSNQTQTQTNTNTNNTHTNNNTNNTQTNNNTNNTGGSKESASDSNWLHNKFKSLHQLASEHSSQQSNIQNSQVEQSEQCEVEEYSKTAQLLHGKSRNTECQQGLVAQDGWLHRFDSLKTIIDSLLLHDDSNHLQPMVVDQFDFSVPSPEDAQLAAARSQSKLNTVKRAVASLPLHSQRQQQPMKNQQSQTKNNNNNEEVEMVSRQIKSVKVTVASKPKQNNSAASRKQKLQELIGNTSWQQNHINLVVIGHVDAGKSTLMGHLLFMLGNVGQKQMAQFERDSAKMGKSSFKYAWVLDADAEERQRGVTIDVAVASFETEHRRFTVLDAPGHVDFIPNMISGASQADAALLVVDASVGGFEAGWGGKQTGLASSVGQTGQTREHALLARSLGVHQMIVVVNKMDTVQWSRQRYDEICSTVCQYLTGEIGFRKEAITCIPVSGLAGQNMLTSFDNEHWQWYKGPSLVGSLDQLAVPERLTAKPFRFNVHTICMSNQPGSSNLFTVSGRVDQGACQLGDDILVMPSREQATIKKIVAETDARQKMDWAAAGDCVQVSLSGLDDQAMIGTGSVLCDISQPVQLVTKFEAQILVFDIAVPIVQGSQFVFYRQSTSEPVTVSALVSIVDQSSGQVIKKSPRAIPKNCAATVQVSFSDQRGVCVETYKDSKDYGRFMLRSRGTTACAGVVTNIMHVAD